MIDLATQLDGMTVRVTSPNGAVSAELTGRRDLRLSFVGSYYYRTDEADLERQCAALCRLLWASHMREYSAVIASAGGAMVEPDAARGPKDVAYFEQLARITAQGGSADGRVAVTAVGMHQWSVQIEPGTLQALSEDEFIADAGQAAAQLIRDQLEKVRRLKVFIYGARRD